MTVSLHGNSGRMAASIHGLQMPQTSFSAASSSVPAVEHILFNASVASSSLDAARGLWRSAMAARWSLILSSLACCSFLCWRSRHTTKAAIGAIRETDATRKQKFPTRSHHSSSKRPLYCAAGKVRMHLMCLVSYLVNICYRLVFGGPWDRRLWTRNDHHNKWFICFGLCQYILLGSPNLTIYHILGKSLERNVNKTFIYKLVLVLVFY